jgi:hypothetical protein
MSMLITPTLETNLFSLNKYIKIHVQMFIVPINTIYSNIKIFNEYIHIYIDMNIYRLCYRDIIYIVESYYFNGLL